jgi:hypothetical protein
MLTSIFSAMFGLTQFSCSLPHEGHLSGTWPGKRTSPIGGNSLFQPQAGQISLKAEVCIGINSRFLDQLCFSFASSVKPLMR